MRTRTFRRKKRLGVVSEDENEPKEEPTPYTSQSLRLATVQPGRYVAWGSLGGADTGLEHLWELRDRFSISTGQLVPPGTDAENEEAEDEEYDDDMVTMIRQQMKAERKIKELFNLKLQEERAAWNASNYKLTSLEGKGEAELIRLIFAYAEVPFDEERVTPEQWEEMKANTPYGTLPVLSKCGKQWGDTGAIVRNLARQHLLMGVTNDEQLVVEATYERLRRLKQQNSLAINWVIRGEKSKEKLEWAQSQLLHVILPPALKEWEQLISKSKGPFVVASGITLADLAMMDFLDQCSSHLMIDSLLADHMAVADLVHLVRICPKLFNYLDERADD